MKEIFFYLVLFCLIAFSVNAAEIGIVVDFPNGKIIKNCVDVNDNTDGYNVLEAANLDILWSNPGTYGHALCKIEGVGDEVSGTMCAWGSEYWGFFIADSSQWNYMPVGHDAPGDCWNGDFSSYGGHYCANNGDVLGYRYGEYGVLPQFFSYDEVCGLEITKVSVNPKKPKPGDKVIVDVSIENDFEFDLEDIELKVWFEDDNGNKLEDDDGDDIEDDTKFDLDERDDESDLDDDDHIFSFEMPYDVDDNDEYYVYVSLEGEQANDSNIIYRALDFSKTIKFSREKHEIEIYKFLVNPEEIKCNRNINLDIGLRNLGEKDEEVTIRISSNELEIDKTESIELEGDADDNEYKNNYNFKIKDDVPEGDYFVTLRVEYNDGNDYETKTTNLKVQECEENNIETLTGQNTLLQSQSTTSQEKTTTSEKNAKTTSNVSALSNTKFLVVFVLGLIIIVIFGALFVAKLLR